MEAHSRPIEVHPGAIEAHHGAMELTLEAWRLSKVHGG
jgi:hypothetical protein